MRNNTVCVDQTSHLTAEGIPADGEPELRCRTVNEVVKKIRARNSGFSASDSLLPSVTLYDRVVPAGQFGRRIPRHTGQVQG